MIRADTDDWQREPGKYGRSYRIVNGVKEYEPTIMTTHGELTIRQLEKINANKRKDSGHE